jgi:phosphate transport system substrate-binding protein
MKTKASNDSFNWDRLCRGTVTGLLGLSVFLPGCSEKQPPPDSAAQAHPQPGAQEKVVIKGSNTIGEELAPKLIAEYKKDHPNIVIDLETKGSGSGFWGLIGGVCDIAAASRVMVKDEQQQAQVRNIELNDAVIGSYCVAVIVNAGNALADLTREQARDLFTGALQNWKEAGGPDAPVHRYIRDPISGTYLGFRELAMEDKPYATNNTTAFKSYAEIVQAVAQDPNGIGYSSIQLAAKPGVKAISIGGVAPVVSSVSEGKYPFSRVLHLYTNKAKEPPAARSFVQFIQSARGREIVDQMGFVPAK